MEETKEIKEEALTEIPEEEEAEVTAESAAYNTVDEAEALSLEMPTLAATAELAEAVENERYKELRALGLTPREAYLATAKPKAEDTRAHLADSYPRASVSPRVGMTRSELMLAREIFEGMSDTEILRLYKKVTAR